MRKWKFLFILIILTGFIHRLYGLDNDLIGRWILTEGGYINYFEISPAADGFSYKIIYTSYSKGKETKQQATVTFVVIKNVKLLIFSNPDNPSQMNYTRYRVINNDLLELVEINARILSDYKGVREAVEKNMDNKNILNWGDRYYYHRAKKDFDRIKKEYEAQYNPLSREQSVQACNYFNTGIDHYTKQQYENAKEFYKKGLDVGPDNSHNRMRYYDYMGSATSMQKKYKESLEFFKKAFEISFSPFIGINFALAYVYCLRKDLKRSQDYYNKCLNLKKDRDKINLIKKYLKKIK